MRYTCYMRNLTAARRLGFLQERLGMQTKKEHPKGFRDPLGVLIRAGTGWCWSSLGSGKRPEPLTGMHALTTWNEVCGNQAISMDSPNPPCS
jgi:hypothetical protein